MKELYFSIDIEADGKIPGPNSMLSLGAVALLDTGKIVGEFTVNLDLLDGAVGDPGTMEWWGKQPKEIWEACRSNPQPPELAMKRFVDWVNEQAREQEASPVCVAYPAGYDFLFVYWYMVRFGQDSPFSFSCLDMKTFAMAKLGTQYRKSTKKNMPRGWFAGLPRHEHVALSDAREQGLLFIAMLKDKGRANT